MLPPFPIPAQSLAHMKVLHRHCVFFSLFPLGPRGLAHIQNDLPQFTPGFLVSMVLHGSPCSHFGETGFEKSFPQVFLDASALASSIVDIRLDSSKVIAGSACEATSIFGDATLLALIWLPFAVTAIGVDSGGTPTIVSLSLVLLDSLIVADLA